MILLIFLFFSLSIALSLTLPSPLDVPEKVLEIPQKTGFLEIVDFLAKEKIIRNRFSFSILAFVKGKARKMRAGEYLFKSSMFPDEVLSKLVNGEEFFHIFTIPEGFNLLQVAQTIEDAGLVKKDLFLNKASDRAFLSTLGIKGSSAEGYLYPDTYRFQKSAGAEKILKGMIERFHEIFDKDCEKRAQELGFTKEEVVVLASIVEKEAGVSWEKPLIAAVFENRLKHKMKLQSDPTVIYGLRDFNGDLTREHLKHPTPFNTYCLLGLPPEPIANPGKESIMAVLYPAKVNFLYFVSRNDGTHYFSTNLQDHNRAVKKYQKSLKITENMANRS